MVTRQFVNRDPFVLPRGYKDFNGLFVDHIIHHNEDPGNESAIAQSIAGLFMKHKTADTHYPISMTDQWYPEYKRKDIRQHYKKEGVSVKIVAKEKEHLVEDTFVYNYTTHFPFWYVVYMYCSMYGAATKKDRITFQQSTKAELKNLFNAVEEEKMSAYRSDAIWVIDMSNGRVMDIGS